jgi:hypothetical protein
MAQTFDFPNLIAGEGIGPITESAIVKSGGVVPLGAIVAKETSSGKIVPYASGGSGGAEIPYGVMSEAVDASTGDKTSLIIVAAEINENAVSIASGTVASVKDALRVRGIYLKPSVTN